jgi:hypothetical protein
MAPDETSADRQKDSPFFTASESLFEAVDACAMRKTWVRVVLED